MQRHDAIIVGGGLFGSIIGAELRRLGLETLNIDDKNPEAGSRPAACLMKPSWFSSLGKEIYDPALETLDRLYGVQDLTMNLRPKLAEATVHWVPPSKILTGAGTLHGTVEAINPGSRGYLVRKSDGVILYAKSVIVAAGVWSARLAPVEGGLKGQAGVAFLWPSSTLPAIQGGGFIQPWAPYRQLVAFDRGDGTWVGDGTSIIRQNWTPERQGTSYERCARAVGRQGEGDLQTGRARALFGIRPYVKRKPCYLEQVDNGLWVATGGAKNGTLAAGHCARVIGEALS